MRFDRLWWTALALGWAFDFFFWKHPPGISVALYVGGCLAGGVWLLTREGYTPAPRTRFLFVTALFFALMFAVRLEPFTVAMNVLLTLVSLALIVVSYRGGRWPEYGLLDYLERAFSLAIGVAIRPLIFMAEVRRQASADRQPLRRQLLPVLRGLLLAIPLLLVFGALLAEADPIFADRLNALLQVFDLERLGEYLLRLAIILVVAYLLAGAFLHAEAASADERMRSGLPAFLGLTEASVVLLAVEALFAFFVAVQFRYFFGGGANVTAAGFTYAEYARRGFSELVWVAFFSLLMLLGLSGITRREAAQQRRFAVLGSVLVALVLVILVSAYQRLVLYENAYGFTRARTVAHLFMVWLGALLAAAAVLEWKGRARLFPLAALVAAMGFGVTLNGINVDGFVARHNIRRAMGGASLDMGYLRRLSADAIPAQAAAVLDDRTPPFLRERLERHLACLQAIQENNPVEDWRSFMFSRWRAEHAWLRLDPVLQRYAVEFSPRYGWQVTVHGGDTRSCWGD